MSSAGEIPRRPLFDPETIPHDPAFGDPAVRGTAVAADRLRPSALRARFAHPPVWKPELNADPRLFQLAVEPRAAAVLVPLVVRGGDVQVLLTERTAHLTDHAGQISFPGGRVEEGDQGPIATALRETEEEIGLAARAVDVLGELPEYSTVTGYRVTPVVGLIEQPFSLSLDAFEVSEAFEVPLAYLMDPVHHERRLVTLVDAARTFYAMPYSAARRYFIWGATAAMLRNLYHFLRA
jgi:8-oxo-dGTP pyrophosphatase MutT (NUDIX family)